MGQHCDKIFPIPRSVCESELRLLQRYVGSLECRTPGAALVFGSFWSWDADCRQIFQKMGR